MVLNHFLKHKIFAIATPLSVAIMSSFTLDSYGCECEKHKNNIENHQNISCIDIFRTSSYERKTAPESIAAAYLAYGTGAITYQELIKELEQGLARARNHHQEKKDCNNQEEEISKILQKAWIELWEKSITQVKNAHKVAKENELRLRDQALHMANNILSIYQASDELKKKVLKKYELTKPDLIKDMENTDVKNRKNNKKIK